MRTTLMVSGLVIGLACAGAEAQSLLRRPTLAPVMAPGASAAGSPAAPSPVAPVPPAPAGATAAPALPSRGAPNPAGALQDYSLFAVVPPPPRTYAKHEQVQIIINETSIQKHQQSLATEKKDDLSAKLSGLPSLKKLLQAQLVPGDDTLIDATLSGDNKFKGDGSYQRKDNFTTRISGTVLDIKPNGLLLLEARTTVQNNGENYMIVVAGTCRPEDITSSNTVQSTQLADLTIKVENDGAVNEAGKKGWLTKFFDTVFNF